ncbi:polysaccharide biosynthesis protein [Marinobacter salinus]|uniref:Polysaccharide biosynthesis protein n=1 Tax=Marinobacter salinus TaxID=1874317 RepID=A0A1D9GIR8_9GAMM|nr:oligosaccharide flippase family protein [Marinobacter salinus]AOY87509.1 polysaccharide biosynthesis protein [Marinobacter salinus]
MSRVRKALLHSSLSQYGARLIGLATTMIVARLLTPEEIGVFAIASAIVTVLSEFKLLGAADYLIREKELSEQKIRQALGLTVLISWGLGITVAFSGVTVAGFYNVEAIETLFYILSINFFLAPFISIPIALVNREFNFRLVLLVNFAGSVASLVSTIVLIKMGFGYYALAWALAVKTLIELLVVLFSSESSLYWKPSFSNVKEIAIFGFYNSGSNLLKRGVKIIPDLVIGKMGTPAQVGLFSRGLGFVDFIAGTLFMGVSPVVLPYLSEVKREQGNILDAYTRAVLMLSAVIWPVLTVAAIASLPTIRIFFGPQWDAAAPVASFMALWLILRTTHNFSNNLLVAVDRERLMLFKELIILVAAVALVIISFPLGLNAVAGSFLVLGVIEIGLVSWILRNALGLKVMKFFGALLPNVIISIVCGLATWAISFVVPFSADNAWKPVGAIALCLPIIWLTSLFLLRHPLATELGFLFRRTIARSS